jgi:hypothetical protein
MVVIAAAADGKESVAPYVVPSAFYFPFISFFRSKKIFGGN